MNRASTTLSRRGFGKILGVGAAYAALDPHFLLSAPLNASKGTDVIRLSANENPYGPAAAALKAMTDAFSLAWRYPDEHAESLAADIARLHDVGTQNILLGDGSGEILKLAATAFTGPGRRLVVSDPTFEAISRHARTAKAETVQLALTSDYSHDLTKMLAQSDAGLVYICNPNNPTASITRKDEIRSFLEKVPASTSVIVDEAYHHYVESADYESVIPLVRQYSNLIVVRTFSKIYGMAGLRCGYCVANPELIRQLSHHQTWDSVNIMAIVAARASLPDKMHVELGRKRNSEVKKYVYSELEKLNLKFIPSHANFMMIDLGQPVRKVIDALRERRVEVGRFFPAMPNFCRVTIGTRPQMEGFVSAFREVIRA